MRKRISLRKGREISMARRHPWVFSGAVHSMDDDIKNGDPVQVVDYRDRHLGVGQYQDGSICVRILSFEDVEMDQSFWDSKLTKAHNLRKQLGLADSTDTNCYRLVNAEGDGLSGLIIDIYNKTAVVQCHTLGMHKCIKQIVAALNAIYGDDLINIYDKHKLKHVEQGFLKGEAHEDEVVENGQKFKVNWVKGQKTGFFLDQRENRQLLKRYATGKSVLNTFCYTGGFSVYAAVAGALKVDSVDVSAHAIDLTKDNMDLNDADSGINRSEIVADVMKHLKENEETYDVMVVDPPAFAKSQRKRHNAVQAYKRLNALAIKRIKQGGVIFTFSCSQVVDRTLFIDTIRAAAIEANRTVQILHHLSQPADHPTDACHPEGAYLKGLVLKIT